MHPRALLAALVLAMTACGPDHPEGCETILDGDLVLDFPPEPGQLAAVEGVDCIRGDLEIRGTEWNPWVCDESGCEDGYATPGSSYAALAKLRRVEGDLRVEGTLLSDLDFLASLEHLGGDLAIIDNELLRKLDGSDRLTRVGGGLEVRGNTSLTYIDGFASLRELAFVSITDNEGPWGVTGLSAIIGLTALETIRGDLHVQDETTLETLEGFRSLREIGGDLEFGHCAGDFSSFESLVSVSGLRSLETVHGDLKLICFAGPADLEGFQRLAASLSWRAYSRPSGPARAWRTGAEPHSKWTQTNRNGDVAVQNTVYDAGGNAVGQVDFKQHGTAAPGHAHRFPPPGTFAPAMVRPQSTFHINWCPNSGLASQQIRVRHKREAPNGDNPYT